MGKEGVQKGLEQKPPPAAPQKRRLCRRYACSMWQVDGSDTVAPALLRKRGTELLCIATQQLVRASLKGDGAVRCEDDSSNIVHDEATAWKGYCVDLSWLCGRHG